MAAASRSESGDEHQAEARNTKSKIEIHSLAEGESIHCRWPCAARKSEI